MSHKAVSFVLLGGAAVIGFLWLRRSLEEASATATAQGVTSSVKGDGAPVTPIQPVAANTAAPADPLAWLSAVTNRAALVVKQSLQGNSLTDWRVPFGNAESADAALNSPSQTNASNYRTNPWSSVQFRSGV